METQATGRRAVNWIKVTNSEGDDIRVMVDNISHYVRYKEGTETYLHLQNDCIDVNETPDEIDKLIDQAMGAE